MYFPVWLFFWKNVKPLGDISESKKCGASFSNLSTVGKRKIVVEPIKCFQHFVNVLMFDKD